MAGITLEQAQARLDQWLDIESNLTHSKSYTIGGRSFTARDADEIRQQIRFWDSKVAELSARSSGVGRSRTVAPGW